MLHLSEFSYIEEKTKKDYTELKRNGLNKSYPEFVENSMLELEKQLAECINELKKPLRKRIFNAFVEDLKNSPEKFDQEIAEAATTFCNGDSKEFDNYFERRFALKISTENRRKNLEFKREVYLDILNRYKINNKTNNLGQYGFINAETKKLTAREKEFLLYEIVERAKEFRGLTDEVKAKLLEHILPVKKNTIRDRIPFKTFSENEMNDKEKGFQKKAQRIWQDITKT